MVLFFSLIFFPGVVVSLKGINAKGVSAERVLTFFLCLLTWLFFIRLNGGRLLNGGVYLLREKAAAAITYEGTVAEISPYDQYSFPNISAYHTDESEISPNLYGCRIVVDNLVLKAPDSGTLRAGDHVSVTFLPKSMYILSISKNEHEITVGEQDG